jgi:hypothetical protein
MSAAAAEPIPTLPRAIAPMAAAIDRFIMFRIVLPSHSGAPTQPRAQFDTVEAAKFERLKGLFL